MGRYLIIAMLGVTASITVAQEPAVEEPPAVRSYTVEMIVFEYAEEVSTGTELFLGDRPESDSTERVPDDAAETETAFEIDATEPEARPPAEAAPEVRQLDLVLLSRDELTMTGTLDRLRRLDAYEPVMHFGWTQPTYPPAETPAIQLRRFGTPPPGLDGSLKLYLSRFLHLVVDLALDARDQDVGDDLAGQAVIEYGDSRMQGDVVYLTTRGPVRYRIREDRIFKSGDVRYFDHPKFGVIAKITRVESEGPATAAATGSARSP